MPILWANLITRGVEKKAIREASNNGKIVKLLNKDITFNSLQQEKLFLLWLSRKKML